MDEEEMSDEEKYVQASRGPLGKAFERLRIMMFE